MSIGLPEDRGHELESAFERDTIQRLGERISEVEERITIIVGGAAAESNLKEVEQRISALERIVGDLLKMLQSDKR